VNRLRVISRGDLFQFDGNRLAQLAGRGLPNLSAMNDVCGHENLVPACKRQKSVIRGALRTARLNRQRPTANSANNARGKASHQRRCAK
jgi:hypothetical protein